MRMASLLAFLALFALPSLAQEPPKGASSKTSGCNQPCGEAPETKAGCGTTCGVPAAKPDKAANKSAPLTLNLYWIRPVHPDTGETPECHAAAEAPVVAAHTSLKRALEPLGFKVVFTKDKLTCEQFKKAPLESNQILFNGTPITNFLPNSKTGSVHDETIGYPRPTIEFSGSTHTFLPPELIVQAGLLAAANEVKTHLAAQAGLQGCGQSCSPNQSCSSTTSTSKTPCCGTGCAPPTSAKPVASPSCNGAACGTKSSSSCDTSSCGAKAGCDPSACGSKPGASKPMAGFGGPSGLGFLAKGGT